MPTIIKQKPHDPALPDPRNLGTILRVLLIVNLGALVFAYGRQPNALAVFDEFIELAAVVEPYLLLVLAVLWAAGPWLARQPFALATILVGAVTVGAGVAVFAFVQSLVPQPPGTLARWLTLGLGSAAGLLFYFHLRAKALRRLFPRLGCRRCRRGSGRISCSTVSTPSCHSCAANRSAPKLHCKTWPSYFACSCATTGT